VGEIERIAKIGDVGEMLLATYAMVRCKGKREVRYVIIINVLNRNENS